MKRSILNIGKTLNKVEQKEIFGGAVPGGPPGFPEKCEKTGAYELPPCNEEQQTLADQGDPYWYCVCGKDLSLDKDAGGFLDKVKGYK